MLTLEVYTVTFAANTTILSSDYNEILSKKLYSIAIYCVNSSMYGTSFSIVASSLATGVHGSLVVSVLDCQSKGPGFKSRPGQKSGLRFLLHLCPLANSAMNSTLTAHCQWEVETVRERTGHQPSYAEAKKMKSLTLHTHGQCSL